MMSLVRDPDQPDLVILRLEGDLNGQDTEIAVNEVEDLIGDGVRRVIVDLTRVQHVSSHGLGLLIRVQHRLRRRGGELKIAGANGIADEALRMTRLNLVFDVHPDLASARAAFDNATLSA